MNIRIIAGSRAGRSIRTPGSYKTHPMSEKVRGALFNVLGDIEGLTFFDAYGGSGAVGIEAASRGAASVVVTDNDRAAYQTIQSNVRELDLGRVISVHQASCIGWLGTNQERTFDIVVADPPYTAVLMSELQRLSVACARGGLYVLSLPIGSQAPTLSGFTLLKGKHYGDAQLFFFRNTQ